eukprot:scaffold8522_cov70-Cylindrotheca_fusiformis.AAC.2
MGVERIQIALYVQTYDGSSSCRIDVETNVGTFYTAAPLLDRIASRIASWRGGTRTIQDRKSDDKKSHKIQNSSLVVGAYFINHSCALSCVPSLFSL